MSPRTALAAALAALALAAPAAPAAPPTLAELENEVMCPTCGVALALSTAPAAQRERALIRRLIAQGLDERQIKDRLVAEYGPGVLATPRAEGFGVAAYAVPAAGVTAALLGIALTLRRRRREPATPEPSEVPSTFEDLVDADLAGRAR